MVARCRCSATASTSPYSSTAQDTVGIVTFGDVTLGIVTVGMDGGETGVPTTPLNRKGKFPVDDGNDKGITREKPKTCNPSNLL